MALIVSILDLNHSNKHRRMATTFTHLSIGFVFVAVFCDIIKMNFGLDPAIPVDQK